MQFSILLIFINKQTAKNQIATEDQILLSLKGAVSCEGEDGYKF